MRRREDATTRGRASVCWLLCLVATLPPTSASAQQPQVFHLSVQLADLSIATDLVSGVSVIMQPSVTTKQKKESFVWLRFHPDSALEWINSAVAAIRTPVAGAQSEGIQWSRTLLPLNGRGALALGRSRKKGTLQKTHWLAVADSVTGWRFELTGSQADSLLRVLLSAASQSAVDTTDSAPLDESRTDVPVRVVSQPTLQSQGRYGRVLAQWVVGTDGRMEPGSFVAYLASDPALAAVALDAIQRSRFLPAERAGKPVRQVVVQMFGWYARAP